jgi:hypothetical protein
MTSRLKDLSEAQGEERGSILQQKKDIQIRLDQYRVKLENDIFPALGQLGEELLTLNLDKSKIEAEVKKLESEIGPIKYIAEIISDFGGPDVDVGTAVRMVILILIFVFDPLAILLIVAASASFKQAREEGIPKDVMEIRSRLINDLENHLADGKSVDIFIERYKI